MKSSILCIIFNRPDTTRVVFEVLQKVKPPKLFICAEGPRENRSEDIELCKKTRAIFNEIDWDCEVYKFYRDKNSGGCGPGVSGAITWFFENVEEGIILEDDIVPHPDFFDYCDEMLEKYRDNYDIKCICGSNTFYDGVYNYPYSYYFSKFMMVWGWATWKRTWKEYDYSLQSVPRSEFLKVVEKMPVKRNSKKRIISDYNIMTSDTPIDTWDYQLSFCIMFHKGLNIIPTKNLCRNIGFGVKQATHTTEANTNIMNHVGVKIYPLNHPDKIVHNKRLDNITFSYYTQPSPSSFKNAYKLVRHYIHVIRMKISKIVGL